MELEQLLVRIIDLFAQRFDKKAVLRGGMVLRLLGCERMTNDLDYIFTPFKSKNDIVEDILSALNEIPGAEISHSLNSKCLRIRLKSGDLIAQIEAKVAGDVRTAIISDRELAQKYGFQPRLLHVVEYPVALANKMAAWNERRLVRDIYDIWFFLKMGVAPDRETLEARLKKPIYSGLVAKEDYFKGATLSDFFDFIRQKTTTLSDRKIESELGNFLKTEDIQGLSMKIKAEFVKLGLASEPTT